MERSVKTRTLQMAAKALGGTRKLRFLLKAPSSAVAAWLTGTEEPPKEVFLRALQIVLDDLDARSLDGKAGGGSTPGDPSATGNPADS
jgi:hypothetical protein